MSVALTKIQAAAMESPAREPIEVPTVSVPKWYAKHRTLVRLACHIGDY